MKTLIFNGSPRVNGDTVSLLKRFTDGLEGEYKIVNAYNREVDVFVNEKVDHVITKF